MRARPCGGRRSPRASTCSSPSPSIRSSCSRPSIVSPRSRTSTTPTMPEPRSFAMHAATDPTRPGRDATSVRILVVDDDADARESLGLLLELDGYEVAYAGDGAEAIRREEAFAPALGLPDIDGEDVARRMRERGTSARIVALSGAPGGGDAGPFDARVSKPARVEDLTAFLP